MIQHWKKIADTLLERSEEFVDIESMPLLEGNVEVTEQGHRSPGGGQEGPAPHPTFCLLMFFLLLVIISNIKKTLRNVKFLKRIFNIACQKSL